MPFNVPAVRKDLLLPMLAIVATVVVPGGPSAGKRIGRVLSGRPNR